MQEEIKIFCIIFLLVKYSKYIMDIKREGIKMLLTVKEILCLFAKDYLTERQFETYLYQYNEQFENELDQDTFLN